MKRAGLLAVGVLALTSCSDGRAAPPSNASDIAPSPALPTATVSSSVHPVRTALPTTTPQTTVAATTVPLTTVAPSITGAATTPTIAPAVDAFCTQLASEPYVVRRALVVDPASFDRAAVAAACADALQWTESAVRVEQAAAAIHAEHGVEGDDFVTVSRCGDSTARLHVRNTTDVAIDAWGAVWGVNPADPVERRGPTPFYVAAVAPGSRVPIDVVLPEGSLWEDAGRYGCEHNSRVFVSAVGDFAADAATPGVPAAEALASDDPAVFVPALDELWYTIRNGARDEASLGLVEDLHSPDYIDTAGWLAEEPAPAQPTPPNPAEVCGTVLQPAPDLQMVAVRRDLEITLQYPSDERNIGQRSTLSFGLLRKGSDGGWRWTGRIVHAHLSDPGTPC
jgi:hypothetical protein